MLTLRYIFYCNTYAQGRPYLSTFFVSNKLSLHPTRAEKVDGLLKNHSGKLVFPPHDYSRVQELQPMEDLYFEVSLTLCLDMRCDIKSCYEFIRLKVNPGRKQAKTS